jgi:hypothetical protein
LMGALTGGLSNAITNSGMYLPSRVIY